MIPSSSRFDQQTMAAFVDADPLVQEYRAFFALFDCKWSTRPNPGIRDWDAPVIRSRSLSKPACCGSTRGCRPPPNCAIFC